MFEEKSLTDEVLDEVLSTVPLLDEKDDIGSLSVMEFEEFQRLMKDQTSSDIQELNNFFE